MEAVSTIGHYTSCKVCASPRLNVADSIHRLVECDECGLIFAHTIYSNIELTDLYTTLYSTGQGYDSHYAAAFNQLKHGKTPWIGLESRAVLRHILRARVKVVGELGASAGMTAQYLKPYGVKYHGIEFDRKTAEMGRRLGYDITCGDHTRLREVCAELDALVAFEVIEHVPDVRECLENIRACLKVRGLLGLTVPNYNRRLNNPRPGFLGQPAPPTHLNFWTVPSLKRTLESCGFYPEIVRVRRRPNINCGNPAATVIAYYRMLIRRFHGPQIICVAQKI